MLSTPPLTEEFGSSGDENVIVCVPSEFWVIVSSVPSSSATVVVLVEDDALLPLLAPEDDPPCVGSLGEEDGALLEDCDGGPYT